MKRIGLIARGDSTGLGIQSKEFYDHIPSKVLLIDSSDLAPGLGQILRTNTDWYPGATVWKMIPGHGMKYGVPRHIIEDFLTDIDVLVAMETPYDYMIFQAARQRGIKTILQLNYEFLDFPNKHLTAPDLFAAPSRWHFDEIPDRKVFLPVPVNTHHFKPQRKPRTFIHIVGRKAIHDRNGTESVILALQHVKNEIRFEIRSQGKVRLPGLPGNVTVNVDASNKSNYYDNYDGGVLIMPRRYGGLCLPINEAIGAEMPVIATDISPNNTWLPKEWLVPARHVHSFMVRRMVDVYEADPIALAAKIDQFCDEGFYDQQIERARKIKDMISWDTLLPLYHKTFLEV